MMVMMVMGNGSDYDGYDCHDDDYDDYDDDGKRGTVAITIMVGNGTAIMMMKMNMLVVMITMTIMRMKMLLVMIPVAMMSTKMLLVMIRMTMMLMNMIMTTMLVFTRRRRRHNLFLNIGAAAGPYSSWADAAAACLLRLMQPLQREKHCKRHGACGIVVLIQTGLMRKWFFPDGAPAEVGLIQTGLWPLPCFAKA